MGAIGLARSHFEQIQDKGLNSMGHSLFDEAVEFEK